MVSNSSVSGGNRPGLVLLRGIIAGSLLGITAFLGKLALSGGIILNLVFILSLALNPVSWLLIITGISGFLLFQSSLHKGKVSIISSIVGGFAIIVPVILALVFLGEFIPEIKWLGILLVVLGAVGLGA